MDICVQLTCGQGHHAGNVQREENQAEIQDAFHFPPITFLYVLTSRPRVVALSPFFSRSILDTNYAQQKEEKHHGFQDRILLTLGIEEAH